MRKRSTVVLQVARVTGGTRQADIISCQVLSVLRQRRMTLAARVLHHADGQAPGVRVISLDRTAVLVIARVEEPVRFEVRPGRKQSPGSEALGIDMNTSKSSKCDP